MTRNGFTLVELLVAMVAASVLLVTLSAAIRTLSERYRRAAAPDAVAEVEATAPFLDAVLGRMRPPSSTRPFQGDERALEAMVPPPAALGPIGLLTLDLATERRADGMALIARFSGIGLPAAAAAPATLASGFRDIRFSYLRRARDTVDMPPRLVTIQFIAKDGTILPLGITPRITMPDCVFDAIDQSCRH